jgi:hypothetical protein
LPGKIGLASPQPIVMMTSEASAASRVITFGVGEPSPVPSPSLGFCV